LFCLLVVQAQKTSGGFSRVIYGNDGRSDTFELNSIDAQLGESAAIIVYGSNIVSQNTDGSWSITETASAEEFWNFCEEERFSQQAVFANANSFCSGFLLSTNPPWLGTAAHCITSNELSSAVVIFGFELVSSSETRLTFDADEVYFIDRIVEQGTPSGGVGDYGIVELDREVTGHTPYTSINSNLQVGESLTLIGHPVGLPKKTDTGGTVTLVDASIVGGTVDSYGGNSGSPVFDDNGRLAGILVGGAQDFVESDDDCDVSNVCPGGPTCTDQGEAIVPICALLEASSTIRNQLNLDCSGADSSNSPVSSVSSFSSISPVSTFSSFSPVSPISSGSPASTFSTVSFDTSPFTVSFSSTGSPNSSDSATLMISSMAVFFAFLVFL